MASNCNIYRRRCSAASEGSRAACAYPRNVAIRPRRGTSLDVAIRPRSGNGGDGSTPALFVLDANSGKAFPDKPLRNRFDRLPIHKTCHDQSEDAFRKLRRAISPGKVQRLTRLCDRIIESGNRRDCLGMTPLHILACSARHDMAAYQLLIDKYPENLITKDGWGDVPLLYAFWGNAPREVINLLVERQRAMFPAHQLDWPGMVETIGRARYLPGWAGASLSCIKSLLDIKRSSFSNQRVDWQKVVTEWAAEDKSNAADPAAPKFHQDAFKHLILFSIAERASSLGVSKWREEILNEIDELCWFVTYRQRSAERVYSQLAHYEHLDQLTEATSMLELALWKAGIDRSAPNGQEERHACRVRCGADVVVPNVLSFLL